VGAVQPPPDVLEDFEEVGRRLRRGGHAGGEGGVEVCVAVDQAGHEDRAAAVDFFVTRFGFHIGTDGGNLIVRDTQTAPLDHRRVELDEGRVLKCDIHRLANEAHGF